MRRNQVWSAILDLWTLLYQRVNVEAEYQAFFERHPIVFEVLGFDAHASFAQGSRNALPEDPELGYRPEPDFICAKRATGEVTVFELKTPFAAAATTGRADGNRTKFRATLETHLKQAREYRKSIEGRPDARAVVKETLGLDCNISTYSIDMIYGMSNDAEAPVLAELADERKTNLRILPYDEILKILISAYAALRPDAEKRNGWTFMARIAVHESQKHSPAYILDCGLENHDRISIWIEGDHVLLRCMDSHGEIHNSRARIPKGPFLIMLRFASDAQGSYIASFLNEHQFDMREMDRPLPISISLEGMSLGASIHGTNNGCFDLYEHVVFQTSLSIEEQIVMHYHFNRPPSGPEHYLEFGGAAQMVVQGST